MWDGLGRAQRDLLGRKESLVAIMIALYMGVKARNVRPHTVKAAQDACFAAFW